MSSVGGFGAVSAKAEPADAAHKSSVRDKAMIFLFIGFLLN
jgi:hypothetical protein